MLGNTVDAAGQVVIEKIFGATPAAPVSGTMLSLESLDDLTAKRDRLQIEYAAARDSDGPTWSVGLVGVAVGVATGLWLL